MANLTDIQFHNVRFCYGEVCAVNDVDFSVTSRKLTLLVGPNGGGKSTLIKLLSGLLKPQEGIIVHRGKLEIGYVPQNFFFDTSFPLTVAELVLHGTLQRKIRPFGRFSAAQKDRAAEAIRKVGLSGCERRGIAQLSGGQLKRAVIARAYASSADMIALDEPDASLDVDAARELYAILDSLKSEKTIVMASHNIEAALDIADTAVYVNKKAVVFNNPSSLKTALKGGISIC
jgi:zinc transport system ATP-binding protein